MNTRLVIAGVVLAGGTLGLLAAAPHGFSATGGMALHVP